MSIIKTGLNTQTGNLHYYRIEDPPLHCGALVTLGCGAVHPEEIVAFKDDGAEATCIECLRAQAGANMKHEDELEQTINQGGAES